MIRPLFAALCLFTVSAAPALSSDVTVAAEHAEVVRLPADASTVVVGNPAIADALVHDARTLVLTGRLPGRTNVIVLDRIGRTIYSRDIVVTSGAEGQVALFRGPQRRTLSCGDTCDEIPAIGDESERFDALSSQQEGRLGIANEGLGDDPDN